MKNFDLEKRRGKQGEVSLPDHSGKRILYQDGGRLVVVTPVAGAEMEDIVKASVPDGVEPVVVDAQDVPTDRTFRAAWKAAEGRLDVDMDLAREIWRYRIRQRRRGLLEVLDVEYQRADEAGDGEEKKRVAERKKRLRDAPADPRIDAAQTPEDLAAIDPLV